MITGRKSLTDVLQQAFKACLHLTLLGEVARNTSTATAKPLALLKFHIQTTSTILTDVVHVLTARVAGCMPSISACTVCVSEKKKNIIALCVINITLFYSEMKEKKDKKYLLLRN